MSDVTKVDRDYLRYLNENPLLASEQCRGLLLAVWDNLSLREKKAKPHLEGRDLQIAVARRLYASEPRALALLDKAERDAAR